MMILWGSGFLSLASDFPDKPITVIVPFGAGGGSDTFVRIFQKAIRDHDLSPQPFVVKNVDGAGGTIGSRTALGAEPDGYTILCLHDGIYTAQHYGNADWGPADFEPVAATGRSGVVVAVAESSPYSSLSELMSVAVRRPPQLVYGTNLGAPNHYSALFLQNGKDGARFRFTQTGGGAKRFNQLKGGHIDVTGFSVAEYEQFKGSGIRALAVLGEEREAALPDLPTAKEQDVDAVHSLMQFWWAPKGTPPERVAYLEDLLRRTMNTSQVKERLAQQHYEPVFHSGEALRAVIRSRSEDLAGLKIKPLDSLPPLHWLALGVVIVCGVWVWREGEIR